MSLNSCDNQTNIKALQINKANQVKESFEDEKFSEKAQKEKKKKWQKKKQERKKKGKTQATANITGFNTIPKKKVSQK